MCTFDQIYVILIIGLIKVIVMTDLATFSTIQKQLTDRKLEPSRRSQLVQQSYAIAKAFPGDISLAVELIETQWSARDIEIVDPRRMTQLSPAYTIVRVGQDGNEPLYTCQTSKRKKPRFDALGFRNRKIAMLQTAVMTVIDKYEKKLEQQQTERKRKRRLETYSRYIEVAHSLMFVAQLLPCPLSSGYVTHVEKDPGQVGISQYFITLPITNDLQRALTSIQQQVEFRCQYLEFMRSKQMLDEDVEAETQEHLHILADLKGFVTDKLKLGPTLENLYLQMTQILEEHQ